MAVPLTLVWFRHDLRLEDHPALTAAAERGTVVPVFIWSPDEESPWAPGAASRWWLHHSLAALQADLRARGSRLIIRVGPAQAQLEELLLETGADAVYWTRRYEPAVRARDEAIAARLLANNVEARDFGGSLLFEPDAIETSGGGPYRVFTRFWQRCLKQGVKPSLLPAPDLGPPPEVRSVALDHLELIPYGRCCHGWTPGEQAARARLEWFVDGPVRRYPIDRERPDLDGTSRLSPHLHFGEISPSRVWAAVREADAPGEAKDVFLAELGWREFAHHLLHHFPTTPTRPLQEEYLRFPWDPDPARLAAWQQGRTGYPAVDAAMRQLLATGWMHNRMRMVVASFLVKDLLIPWQTGAAWFRDRLVDADLANNTLNWQWVAGCGADSAPFFRVFNPTTQGQRYDPEGDYVRQWVPELAPLPDGLIHEPAAASAEALQAAGVRLGDTYPEPLVDHRAARERALAAYRQLGGRG